MPWVEGGVHVSRNPKGIWVVSVTIICEEDKVVVSFVDIGKPVTVGRNTFTYCPKANKFIPPKTLAEDMETKWKEERTLKRQTVLDEIDEKKKRQKEEELELEEEE